MKSKMDETKLIAYLYDELTIAERKEVETYLAENKDARKELEELKEVRAIYAAMPEQEVQVPHFTFQKPSVLVGEPRVGSYWWKLPLSIAASLILVMLFGYVTSFRFTVDDGAMQVAFGDTEEVPQENLTPSQVTNLISNAISENRQVTNVRLDQLETKFRQSSSPAVQQDLLNQYTAQLREFNKQTLESMLANSAQEHKQEMNEAMEKLLIYLDVQRQNDLEVFQARFENLENDTNYNQQFTNQVLTNLMSSVEEQSINQY